MIAQQVDRLSLAPIIGWPGQIHRLHQVLVAVGIADDVLAIDQVEILLAPMRI